MKVYCPWHDPPKYLYDREPLEDPTETQTMCMDCYRSLMEGEGKTPVEIPEQLGQCEITRVEAEGTLHIHCQDKFFKVETSGQFEEEEAPEFLAKVEETEIEEEKPLVEVVESTMEEGEEDG